MRTIIVTFAATAVGFFSILISAEPKASTLVLSPLTVTVYACPVDADIAPTVSEVVSETNVANPVHYPGAFSAQRVGPGIWRVRGEVPTGRWDVRIMTPHCSVYVTTILLDGESREFVTALFPTYGKGIFDENADYIAGEVPFTGYVTSLFRPMEAQMTQRTLCLMGAIFTLTKWGCADGY
jgi:hypothetical protein